MSLECFDYIDLQCKFCIILQQLRLLIPSIPRTLNYVVFNLQKICLQLLKRYFSSSTSLHRVNKSLSPSTLLCFFSQSTITENIYISDKIKTSQKALVMKENASRVI